MRFITPFLVSSLALLALAPLARAATLDPIADLKNSTSIVVEPVVQNKKLVIPSGSEALKPQIISSPAAEDCVIPASTLLFNVPPRDQIKCDVYKDPALTGLGNKIVIETSQTGSSGQQITPSPIPKTTAPPVSSGTEADLPAPTFNYDTTQNPIAMVSTFSYAGFTREPARTLSDTGAETTLPVAFALGISTFLFLKKKMGFNF